MSKSSSRTWALIALLPAALAWPCSPDESPRTISGNLKAKKLALHLDEGSKLLRAGKVLATFPGRPEYTLFTADDEHLALAFDEGHVIVTSTATGKQVSAKVLSVLSEDEHSKLPFTSCGTEWFGGWSADAKGLEITVSQNGQRRPTQPVLPGIVVTMSWSGQLVRETPLPSSEIADYLNAYHAAKDSQAREDALASIADVAAALSKPGKAEALGSLLDEAVAAPDATVGQLKLVLAIAGHLPAGDQKRLATAALARKTDADGEALSMLGRDDADRRALAVQVFRQRDRSPRSRAYAASLMLNARPRPDDALVLEALHDPLGEVRAAAADFVSRNRPVSNPMFQALLDSQAIAQPDGGTVTPGAWRSIDFLLEQADGPGYLTMVAAEDKKRPGKLWPRAYLELAYWSNHSGRPKDALAYLDKGLALGRAGDEFNFAQLLATKLGIAESIGDRATAASALQALVEMKYHNALLCGAQGEALRAMTKSSPCEGNIMIDALIKRAQTAASAKTPPPAP